MSTNQRRTQMSGKTAKHIVFAGACAALGLGSQSVAQACTPVPPRCVEVPPDGATFPAHAVAFRLFKSQDPLYRRFESELALRTEDGAFAVPASVKTLATGERVFSPDQALEPNRRYVLHYESGACPSGPSRPNDFTFLTTEPISFPPNAGTLDVVAQGIMDVGGGTRFAFVALKLLETPESQAFLALRTYQVEIDGRALAYEGRFTVGTAREIFIPSVCPDSVPLENPCGGGPVGVPAGRHVVKVTPQILGAPAGLPALEKEIQISCDENLNSSNTLPTPVAPNPTAGPMAGTAPESPAACSFAAGSRS